MPRLKSLLPTLTHSWTKVPNQLLDRLLPILKDTELRILLVVLRETSGWNKEGEPLTLSYRKLMEKTGRGSEAIAAALASLERRRLIHRPQQGSRNSLGKAKRGASKSEDQQYKDN